MRNTGRRHDGIYDDRITESKPLICGRHPDVTILYCSSDRLGRCGAPVQNLSHSESFQSRDKNAPSQPGIKHLAFIVEVRDKPRFTKKLAVLMNLFHSLRN